MKELCPAGRKTRVFGDGKGVKYVMDISGEEISVTLYAGRPVVFTVNGWTPEEARRFAELLFRTAPFGYMED